MLVWINGRTRGLGTQTFRWMLIQSTRAPAHRTFCRCLSLQQRWDEYSTDHSSIGKAVELNRLVERAKKADPAYFDRVHSLPIRRLRHCTHLSEAASIINANRRGEATFYEFKGFNFRGFQGERRHVPFVYAYDPDKRTYVQSDGDKFTALGELVWFGLETTNDDKEPSARR